MFPGTRKKSQSENRYELIEKIGKGGMGIVWKAFDRRVRTHVALKTLGDSFDETTFKLFKDECQKLVELPYHPNIIRIMDIGELDSGGNRRPFFTMPLLSGATLAERMKDSEDKLTVERVVEIACQTCRGLQHAHAHRIIHRDIKPSNIFILDDFSAQIIDFGVAHRTGGHTGTAGRKGTVYYMSPEQVQGGLLSAASDVFSLGVVCYEVLSRRRPFEGKDDDAIFDAIRSHQPPALHEFPLGISVAVSQAIHKALAKKPSDRYLTASEFAEVLQKALHMKDGALFPLPRPRLVLAASAFQKGDYQFAEELLDTLQAEGVSHPEITNLRKQVEAGIRERRITQGVDAARSLMEVRDYLQAAKRVKSVLIEDPNNTDARALEKQIEARRTQEDVEQWLKLARQHMENFAFELARQALDRVIKQRPKEPRATLLLSELSRLEEEYGELQREKQRHFEAVQSALRRKDISSAYSHVEHLWELEQRRPEMPDPNRTAYQNIYNQVRSEREGIDTALQQANRYVEAGDLTSALRTCKNYLDKYPTHEHLLHLQFKIEELQQQALSARMAEVDRSVQAEADLHKRVRILEDALHDYPGESHFERSLLQARSLCSIVEGILAKAKAHEEQKEYSEAQQEWLKLKTIYPRYSGLGLEIERIARLRSEYDRRQAKNRVVQQIDRHLDMRNFHAALDLIHQATMEHRLDAEIATLEKIALLGIQAIEQAQQVLADGQMQCQAGRFENGLKLLREAHDLDVASPAITSALLDALVEFARANLDFDRVVGEASLVEALRIDPNHAPALGLMDLFEGRRKQQRADTCITKARELQTQGDLRGALRVLDEVLQDDAGDERMLQRRVSIQKQLDEERDRDTKSARKLIQEAESITDPPTLEEYSGRLHKISQRHPDDSELQDAVGSFHRRLQTATDLSCQPISRDEARVGSASKANAHGSIEKKASTSRRLGEVLRIRVLDTIDSAKTVLARLGVGSFSQRNQWAVMAGAALLTVLLIWGGAGLFRNHSEPSTKQALAVRTPKTRTEIVPPPPQEIQPPPRQILSISGQAASLTIDDDVNNKQMISGGEEVTRELADGEHSIKVLVTPTLKLSVTLQVQPDQPAILKSLQSQKLLAVVMSSFGGRGSVYATPAVALWLDGNSLGSVGESGVALPVFEGEQHTLRIQIGTSSVSNALVLPKGRAVRVYLSPDPTRGGIVVRTKEAGVTLVLFVSGKVHSKGMARSGSYRFLSLRPGAYVMRAAKEGFRTIDESVTIVAGKEETINLDLKPIPTLAAVTIRSRTGAQIYLSDGTQVGTVQPDGILNIQDLPPGQVTFEARLEGYPAFSKPVDLKAGANEPVELPLSQRLPGALRINRNPAGSVVTYQRSDESDDHVLTMDQIDLSEGTYTLRASAPGFALLSKSVVIHAGVSDEVVDLTLKALPSTEPESELPAAPAGIDRLEAAVWTKESDGSRIKKRGGSYAIRETPGSIRFTASPVQDVKAKVGGVFGRAAKIQWAIGFKKGDYVICIIEGDNYSSFVVSGTQRTRLGEAKLKRQDKYQVEVAVGPTEFTVKVLQDGVWKQLQEKQDLDAKLLQGSFAFQEQVRLYDLK